MTAGLHSGSGGAGFIGDHVIGPAAVAAIKGRDMLVTGYAALFNAVPI